MQYALKCSSCFQGGAISWSCVGRAGVCSSGSEQENLPSLFVLFICSAELCCNSSPSGSRCSRSGSCCCLFVIFYYLIGVEWLLCSNKESWSVKGTSRAEFLLGKTIFQSSKALRSKNKPGLTTFFFFFFGFTIALENTAMQLLVLICGLKRVLLKF